MAFCHSQTMATPKKELRRLPHIFANVLELPFPSHAHVLAFETSDSLQFTLATNRVPGAEIRAETVQIYPGLTKIVIKGDGLVEPSAMELELDFWRIRLPELVVPELAQARYVDGEVVVTVPKGTTGI